MKNIKIVITLLAFAIILLSCEKETETYGINATNNQETNIQQNSNKVDEYLISGELFHDGGITGWIDPKIVQDSIQYKQLVYGPKDFLGGTYWNPLTGRFEIYCINPGKNCGKIYLREPGKPDVHVGFYIEN